MIRCHSDPAPAPLEIPPIESTEAFLERIAPDFEGRDTAPPDEAPPPPFESDGRHGGSQPSEDRPEAAAGLPLFSAASLADKPVPPRRWLVPEMVPDRSVTLLGGDGSVGKSTIAMQLSIAIAGGREWLGKLPGTGPVIFVSAEDELDELCRRLSAIADANGVKVTDLGNLHFIPLAGRDAILAAPAVNTSVIMTTKLWSSLVEIVARTKPRLIVLDTLADVFAGNENVRQEARRFIGLLRGLAIVHDLAVLLLAHPSLSGLSSGSGTSGSTAWSNSVRSRLYLETIKDKDGREFDANLRVLCVKKSNYGPAGLKIRLRWTDGCFVLDSAPVGLDRLAADNKAEQVFLSLLARLNAQCRDVSVKPSPSFAPTVFAKHPDSEGIRRDAFSAAMERLLSKGCIRVDPFGPPSKKRSRLIIVAQKVDNF